MNMKKLLLIVSVLLCTGAFAQRGGGPAKIKALKTAHITDKLDLTPEEAEKFWPVYNKHEQKMEGLRRTERQEIGSVIRTNGGDLSDAEANTILDRLITLKSNELENRKALIKDLKNVIPPQKILKLHRAEEEFKRMLLERFRGRGRN